MKNFLLASLLSLLCLINTNFAQEEEEVTPEAKSYEFRGVVKTADDSVFAGIPVFFKRGEKSEFVSTDINGEFSIKLAPGNYEVTVRRTLSETFKAYIFIQENGLNPQNVVFTVAPNAVCCGDSSEKPYPKIINMARPGYPAAARAVRAFGEVVVEVKIDKAGKIVSAKAVSGHPLLRAVSEKAAQLSRYEASENDDPREVKLTFVFLPENGEKEGIKRYSNPYRVEVLGEIAVVDTADVK